MLSPKALFVSSTAQLTIVEVWRIQMHCNPFTALAHLVFSCESSLKFHDPNSWVRHIPNTYGFGNRMVTCQTVTFRRLWIPWPERYRRNSPLSQTTSSFMWVRHCVRTAKVYFWQGSEPRTISASRWTPRVSRQGFSPQTLPCDAGWNWLLPCKATSGQHGGETE